MSLIFHTWLNGPGTTECLITSIATPDHQVQWLSFWSKTCDGSTLNANGAGFPEFFDHVAKSRVTTFPGRG